MTRPRFDVLSEPWIGAVDLHGRRGEYGLLSLLARAPALRAVVDSSPVVQFGLYRLLVAFVQAALHIVEMEDLEDALDEGAFDDNSVVRYVEKVGRHRFDLFDPERPFLQTAPTGGSEAKHSVARLFYHLPAGTNVLHFSHAPEVSHAVSPAVAARGLCSIAPFMTSGGAGYSPSINGSPPWYVLVLGDNLFQTILLNCCVMDIPGLARDGPPVWAKDDAFVPRGEKGVNSIAEGLTWQPRQVRLLPSAEGVCTSTGVPSPVLVRQIVWGPGHKFGGQDVWRDPHVAYTHDERHGSLPLRPRPGRKLWRDFGPLFLLRDDDRSEHRFSRPAIVRQLGLLKDEGAVPPKTAAQVEVYGMRVDKAKVFEWHHQRLSLETGVLRNPTAGVQVQHALDLAEKTSSALYDALQHLHPRRGGGHPPALNRIIGGAQDDYWTRLQLYFEEEYLPALARQGEGDLPVSARRGEGDVPVSARRGEGDVPVSARRGEGDRQARLRPLTAWQDAVQRIAWDSFHSGCDALGDGGPALQRRVAARNVFARSLGRIFKGGRSKSRQGSP